MSAIDAIPRAPARPLRERALDVLVWGGLIGFLAVSVRPVELHKLAGLVTKSRNMHDLLLGLAQPDFSLFPTYVAQMWLTLQMALWGTALAVLLAVPFGLLCARNMTPVWIQQPMRRLMDLVRAIPALVIGLLFVVAVGLGPASGVLAIAFNTGGVLAKLFSEAVEAIDPRPVEGVRATGASRVQEIAWGVIPQVAPLWTSFSLYRFESNAREATVLGLIGAGGIGQLLFEDLNAFKYRETSAIVIVIVAAVTLIDLLSQAIRKRLI